MQKTIITLLIILSQIAHTQEVIPDTKKNPISLLPDGSVLKGVLLPRYDEERNLVGDLKAETLTLVDEQLIKGSNIRIRFYHPDGKLRGNIDLIKARFNQKTSRLHADEIVKITSDRLIAHGTGITYGFQNGEGFLRGPATTWIKAEPKTSMNIRRTPASAIAAALLTSFSPITAYAAPPNYVSEAELAAIKSDAKSTEPQLQSSSQTTAEKLKDTESAGQNAGNAAHTFIEKSELKTVATEEPVQNKPAAQPLKVPSSPDDTVINCEKGMYFDIEGGFLVYIGNVTVTDPRFTLTGANELKVFFDKKEPTDKKKGTSIKLGEVQRLLATGAVRILQKSVDGKDPVEASGAILSYDVPKGEIIISDGFPWVKQGNFYARAKEAGLTLRLLNDGSFSTRGNWEMGGNFNLDR